MSRRGSSYNTIEDQLLCEVYVDISQDLIIKNNRSSKQFWPRVEAKYNESKHQSMVMRSMRSLQTRMSHIEKSVRKLIGCVRQIEQRHPSGAVEVDILNEAKILFIDDPKFRCGFKYDHVWSLLKDFENFRDDVIRPLRASRKFDVNYLSSESENPIPESPLMRSNGISNFDINLGGSSSHSIGVKKEKLKKKIDNSITNAINKLQEESQKLTEMMADVIELKKQSVALKAQRIAMKVQKEEDNILMQDLTTIVDPNVQSFFEARRNEILQKRGILQPAERFA